MVFIPPHDQNRRIWIEFHYVTVPPWDLSGDARRRIGGLTPPSPRRERKP